MAYRIDVYLETKHGEQQAFTINARTHEEATTRAEAQFRDLMQDRRVAEAHVEISMVMRTMNTEGILEP